MAELKRCIAQKKCQVTLDYGEIQTETLESMEMPWLEDTLLIMTTFNPAQQVWFGMKVSTVWFASFFALALSISVLIANCDCCAKPDR